MKKKDILNQKWKSHKGEIYRLEFASIVDLINSNSTVLDVGCGDGSLGRLLMEQKSCKVLGIDISQEAIKIAREKGIDTKIGDIEDPLPFHDNSFDYVVLCDVLEHLIDPLQTLREALRVCRRDVIVAFPNFAVFSSRLELLFGNFPEKPLFGYKWFNSAHIRLFSYKDFVKTLRKLNFNVEVVDKKFLPAYRFIPAKLVSILPNFFAGVCILNLRKNKNWSAKDIKSYEYDI